MIKDINFIKEKVSTLRNSKNNKLNFIQIGAYDGVSFDDIANQVLLPTDRGVFVEPNSLIFNTLKNNKALYKESIFLQSAIIPNESFQCEDFYVDVYGGQSTFVKDVISDRLHKKIEKVDVITVKDFINNYISFDIDVIFIDCEGYDHDIVKELLLVCNPSVIYFETWDTVHLNIRSDKHIFTTREEIIDCLAKNNYNYKFVLNNENIIAYKL